MSSVRLICFGSHQLLHTNVVVDACLHGVCVQPERLMINVDQDNTDLGTMHK